MLFKEVLVFNLYFCFNFNIISRIFCSNTTTFIFIIYPTYLLTFLNFSFNYSFFDFLSPLIPVSISIKLLLLLSRCIVLGTPCWHYRESFKRSEDKYILLFITPSFRERKGRPLSVVHSVLLTYVHVSPRHLLRRQTMVRERSLSGTIVMTVERRDGVPRCRVGRVFSRGCPDVPVRSNAIYILSTRGTTGFYGSRIPTSNTVRTGDTTIGRFHTNFR